MTSATAAHPTPPAPKTCVAVSASSGFGTSDHADGDAGSGELDGDHAADAALAPGDEGDRAGVRVRVHGETMRPAPGRRDEHGLLNFDGPLAG